MVRMFNDIVILLIYGWYVLRMKYNFISLGKFDLKCVLMYICEVSDGVYNSDLRF